MITIEVSKCIQCPFLKGSTIYRCILLERRIVLDEWQIMKDCPLKDEERCVKWKGEK
jgi:hypothetical protein